MSDVRGAAGYHVDYGALARRSARFHMHAFVSSPWPVEPPATMPTFRDSAAVDAVTALLEWVYPTRVYRMAYPYDRVSIDESQSYVAQLWAVLDNRRAPQA